MLVAPAFVDRVLGADEIGMMLRHPARTHSSAGLFVGVRHKNQIAFERNVCALDERKVNQLHRDHLLHIGRAASPDDAVHQIAGERRALPFVRFGGNDIYVSHQQQRRERAVAFQPRDEVAALRRGFQHNRLDAFAFEFRRDVLDARAFRCPADSSYRNA